jgi:hypothetical protein
LASNIHPNVSTSKFDTIVLDLCQRISRVRHADEASAELKGFQHEVRQALMHAPVSKRSATELCGSSRPFYHVVVVSVIFARQLPTGMSPGIPKSPRLLHTRLIHIIPPCIVEISTKQLIPYPTWQLRSRCLIGSKPQPLGKTHHVAAASTDLSRRHKRGFVLMNYSWY